jgi:hypothetical protein
MTYAVNAHVTFWTRAGTHLEKNIATCYLVVSVALEAFQMVKVAYIPSKLKTIRIVWCLVVEDQTILRVFSFVEV